MASAVTAGIITPEGGIGLVLNLNGGTSCSTAEDHIEVILKIREALGKGIGNIRTGTTPSLPGLTAAGIAEHRIGLIDQLEALFSNGIVAVEIGVPAARLPAKGPFQLLIRAVGINPQQRPVIRLSGRCHRPKVQGHAGSDHGHGHPDGWGDPRGRRPSHRQTAHP